MKDAQKPDHQSLINMVTRLCDGRYVIPDFQRELEWEPSDINELMSSIFRDYYIGSLLLWKGKDRNFKALACESIYGFNGLGEPTHIVLDGQQRLSAMYYAFMAPDKPAPNRKNRVVYFIKVDRFIEEAYEDAFVYDWTRRGLNLLENSPQQFAEHMFPLSVIGQGGSGLWKWLDAYRGYWGDKAAGSERQAQRHAANAEKFVRRVDELINQYQISYIELDQDLELEKICDIFTQINSRGRRLGVFDLMNALLRPKGLQLKHLWREAEPRLEFVEVRRMNVYVLQTMSILRQSYCSPKYLYYLLPDNPRQVRGTDGVIRPEVLVADTEEFQERWNEAVAALEAAIKLLRQPQEFGVISAQYLPYASILPVFAALLAEAEKLSPEQKFSALQKIRFWYWASVFTNRYSGAVESTNARDFLDVNDWFADDQAEPSVISEYRREFDTINLSKETKKGSSVYNGIFNLLIISGARDWIKGTVPSHGDMDDHHIVPQSWDRKEELRTSIHTILNRTPLTKETNRDVIGGRLPNEYLPEWIKRNGESKVEAILDSHFISKEALEILTRDPFGPEDFEAFVEERQLTLLAAIEKSFVKKGC